MVLNSGGANACTGPDGFADTHRTAEHLAELLGVGAGEVAVASTGLIGVRLPMQKLLTGVDKAVANAAPRRTSRGRGDPYDGHRGQAAVGGRGTDTVGGMAKGAGMLAPSLATMLCVLTTDAAVSAEVDAAHCGSRRDDLHRVDSDGCLSTNDTVLLLASGASGNPGPGRVHRAGDRGLRGPGRSYCSDAEGSSKTVTIDVVNAASEEEAVLVGRAIARNNLLMCALHGEDPNWGRVLAAIGTTDATFDPDAIDVAMNGVTSVAADPSARIVRWSICPAATSRSPPTCMPVRRARPSGQTT